MKNMIVISGNNRDVKSFLKDLPVRPGEKVSEFIRTFHDNPELRQVVQGLYFVNLSIAPK